MRRPFVAVWIGLAALALASGCGKEQPPAPAAPQPAAQQAAAAGAEAAKAGAEAAKAGEAAAQAAGEAVAGAEGVAAKAEAAVKEEVAKVQPLVEGAQALATEGAALSLDDYEKLMLGLAACELKAAGIDRECAAFKAFNEARKTRGTALKDLAGGIAGLGRKHIRHASPAVRLHAAGLMASLFGADESSQAVIVEVAGTEENPIVLRELLRSVGSSSAKNPAVRDLLLAKADHPDEGVRMEAGGWLTSSWAAGTEGTLEKAMALIEGDASVKVRKHLCATLGKRADDRALPLFEAHTKDPADPLYADCLRGVIEMWSSPVPQKAPSQKAYELTLALLRATPRSEQRPPWNALSGLQWANKPELQAAAPWFKKEDVTGALKDVVLDRAANWMARTASIDSLLKLEAPKALFEELLAAYADAAGSDAHVKKKLEDALAKAK